VEHLAQHERSGDAPAVELRHADHGRHDEGNGDRHSHEQEHQHHQRRADTGHLGGFEADGQPEGHREEAVEGQPPHPWLAGPSLRRRSNQLRHRQTTSPAGTLFGCPSCGFTGNTPGASRPVVTSRVASMTICTAYSRNAIGTRKVTGQIVRPVTPELSPIAMFCSACSQPYQPSPSARAADRTKAMMRNSNWIALGARWNSNSACTCLLDCWATTRPASTMIGRYQLPTHSRVPSTGALRSLRLATLR